MSNDTAPKAPNPIQASPLQNKKILENPFVGSLVMPIAIVLVGSLLIFGVTKMLSSERSYRDLVVEIGSKTFGNKWVAAYELSKQINSSQIPAEEYPWIVENLSQSFKDSVDPRTKGFIVAALGALKTADAIPTFELALEDADIDVKFHGLVALASLPKEDLSSFTPSFDWRTVTSLLKSEETSLRQAALLTLGTHRVLDAQDDMAFLLNDNHWVIKYAAATSLIVFKDERARDTLEEILSLSYPDPNKNKTPVQTKSPSNGIDGKQVVELKMAVLDALEKNPWDLMEQVVSETAEKDSNISIRGKAKDLLNLLKN